MFKWIFNMAILGGLIFGGYYAYDKGWFDEWLGDATEVSELRNKTIGEIFTRYADAMTEKKAIVQKGIEKIVVSGKVDKDDLPFLKEKLLKGTLSDKVLATICLGAITEKESTELLGMVLKNEKEKIVIGALKALGTKSEKRSYSEEITQNVNRLATDDKQDIASAAKALLKKMSLPVSPQTDEKTENKSAKTENKKTKSTVYDNNDLETD